MNSVWYHLVRQAHLRWQVGAWTLSEGIAWLDAQYALHLRAMQATFVRE